MADAQTDKGALVMLSCEYACAYAVAVLAQQRLLQQYPLLQL